MVGEQLLRRAVHLGRLQPSAALDPVAARQGASACCARRASTRAAMTARRWSTSWRTSPATSCSRSREDELFEIAHRHPASAGTAAHRAVRAARPVRALRHLPRLYPARPLRHRSAPAHSGDPGEGLRRHLLAPSITQLAESVLARVQFVIETKPRRYPGLSTWPRSRSG